MGSENKVKPPASFLSEFAAFFFVLFNGFILVIIISKYFHYSNDINIVGINK